MPPEESFLFVLASYFSPTYGIGVYPGKCGVKYGVVQRFQEHGLRFRAASLAAPGMASSSGVG
jgi:hypothetical protein